MQFTATARYVWYSPYKLRPLADVIRGKDVTYALDWLTIYRNQRVMPIKKVVESALANAINNGNAEKSSLKIKEIRVDQGPTRSYFKPGAMGRAMPQTSRSSHITVTLETKSLK